MFKRALEQVFGDGDMETNVTHGVVRNSKDMRLIKKYENRKLYDTRISTYVTLDDLAAMVRTNYEFTVIDNKTKADITALTLTQIIFENERRAGAGMPVPFLKEIIKSKGNLTEFLLKFGVFEADQLVSVDLKKNTESQTTNENTSHSLFGLKAADDFLKPEESVTIPANENTLPVGILG